MAPAVLLAQQYVISTFAGGAPPRSVTFAPAAVIGVPTALTADAAGNVYIASLNCILRVAAQNPFLTLKWIAGDSHGNYGGDGEGALNAELYQPGGIVFDAVGNLYIADTLNQRIRRITPGGIIATIAGTGAKGYSGDGGPAATARFFNPSSLVIDKAGNLYVADVGNGRIRRIAPNGVITTIAGNGTPGSSGDGGNALNAQLSISGLAIDSAGNIYISDSGNQRVRKVSTDGTIRTFAGTGVPGYAGDGGPAADAQFVFPMGLAVDARDNLLIVDSANHRVRRVSAITGQIDTIAGNGTALAAGDGGPAINAGLIAPSNIAVDEKGDVFISDANSTVRMVSPSGTISTVAGPGTQYIPGANIPTTFGQFSGPQAVAADATGNVYVADTGNALIWKVNNGSMGVATGALKGSGPVALAVNDSGTVDIAFPHTVGQLTSYGLTIPVAGGGYAIPGDGGPATSAQLVLLSGAALDASGNLYVSDLGQQSVRKISPSGVISTIAGTGVLGYSGDGGLAVTAQLHFPRGLAIDSKGNLFVADSGNNRVRKISPDGIITTVAGMSPPSSPPAPGASVVVTGDGGQATNAALSSPSGVAVDAAGNLYIADKGFHTVRKVTSDGVISTIAGITLNPGYYGDLGIGTKAAMNQPYGIAVDSAGNVYVADQGNNVVRVLRPVNRPALISAVFDAASESAVPITPGKIITIYGSGLGPATLAVNEPVNGVFGTTTGGSSVSVNGIPAPMIYASEGQVAAIVPYGIAGSASAQVVVTSAVGVTPAFPVAVAASGPSMFSHDATGAGQIAAVNLDGSLNDATHPAAVGSYISIYATGEGQTFPAGVDGAITSSTYAKPVLPVRVTIGGVSVMPDYAGAAPAEVAGLMQIVVKIPSGINAGGYVPVVLQVGDQSTVDGAAWIAVSGN